MVTAGQNTESLSVAVEAGGGPDVSYAIQVHNTTGRAVPDAVITQRLPPNLDYVDAVPPPERTGQNLTWTLAIPAHGTARITTTGTADRHLGGRPLAHVTQAGALHDPHPQLTTTVCVREDTGPQACATGRSALRESTLPGWGRIALGPAIVALTAGAWYLWRRRTARAGRR
jgi:hypothetical protein